VLKGRSQTPNHTFERILVIRGGGLGDFVLILPVLAALRQSWPNASVELLCNPEMGEMAQQSQYAERVRSIHDAEVASFFSDHPSVPRAEYLKGFDLVISFLTDQTGCLEKNLRRHVPQVVMIPPPTRPCVHAALHFLSSLEALRICAEDYVPKLAVLPRARTAAGRLLPGLFSNHKTLPIAVHPGSGSPQKNWSTKGYSDLILWLKEDLGRVPLLVTGEADTETRRNLRQELGQTFTFEISRQPLRVLAPVLQCCSLLIGNDSGVTHLAAALGTPVLAFFGPTSPQIWRPLGERVRILGFEEASPDRVHQEILKLL